MKHTDEVQSILTAIFAINRTNEHEDKDISLVLDYAFRRFYSSNTNLLTLACIGKTKTQIMPEVTQLLETTTQYKKYLFFSILSPSDFSGRLQNICVSPTPGERSETVLYISSDCGSVNLYSKIALFSYRKKSKNRVYKSRTGVYNRNRTKNIYIHI